MAASIAGTLYVEPAPAPSATFVAVSVSPASVLVGGTLTLVADVNATTSTYWRLELYVQDSRTGQNIASFPVLNGLRGTQEVQITSGPLNGAQAGDNLAIVGSLTMADNSAMTGAVQAQTIDTGNRASVPTSTSSGTGSGGTTAPSAECQSLYDQYSSLYQQQTQLRYQAAADYPNVPQSLYDDINSLGAQMDQVEVEYGQNGCTVTLP